MDFENKQEIWLPKYFRNHILRLPSFHNQYKISTDKNHISVKNDGTES